MDSKFDPLPQKQSLSPDSLFMSEEKSAVTEPGIWDASKNANLSTGGPSVPLSGATGFLDVSKTQADTQTKWDDVWEPADSITESKKPQQADFQNASYTNTSQIKDTSKQTIDPVLKVLQEQIAKRTTLIDAATKEKTTKILEASKEYIEQQRSKREKQIAESKELHKKTQDNDGKKLEDFQKSGAVWSAVGMVVDLQKPNAYSKNTERMRSILSTLNQPGEVISK